MNKLISDQSNGQASRRRFHRNAVAVALFGVTAAASMLPQAQAQADAARPGKGIEVPCCVCIDGKTTTIDISTGTAPWTSPNGPVTAVPSPNVAWASKPPAKWVYTGNNAPGSYTYNLPIHVPNNCIIPMDVRFEGIAYGDNNITIKLDDRQLGTTPVSSGGAANYGFRDPYGVSVNGAVSGGTHTLSVTVRNDGGPTGFLFNGKLTIKCSSGPLTHQRKD